MKFFNKIRLNSQHKSNIPLKIIIIIFIIISLVIFTIYLNIRNNSTLKFLSDIEIATLKCRKAEKNFLLRHDQASVKDFHQKINDLKNLVESSKVNTKDKVVLAHFEDIEINKYL